MKNLIIKYSNYADNQLGLHTKKFVANSFGEMMAELAAWLMQPAYVADGAPEHRVVSLGWQGEGQHEAATNGNASNAVYLFKTILMQEAEVDASIVKKATKYDDLVAVNRIKGAKSAASLTAAERSARAKKAVAARIEKYGQKRR